MRAKTFAYYEEEYNRRTEAEERARQEKLEEHKLNLSRAYDQARELISLYLQEERGLSRTEINEALSIERDENASLPLERVRAFISLPGHTPLWRTYRLGEHGVESVSPWSCNTPFGKQHKTDDLGEALAVSRQNYLAQAEQSSAVDPGELEHVDTEWVAYLTLPAGEVLIWYVLYSEMAFIPGTEVRRGYMVIPKPMVKPVTTRDGKVIHVGPYPKLLVLPESELVWERIAPTTIYCRDEL